MKRKVMPWKENIFGFEGFLGAQKQESLSLERIVCTLDALEKGEDIPPINLIHYKTQRTISKKRGIINKKVKVSTHNYDLPYGIFETANYDGGHTRAMASTLGQHPILANIIEESDAWDIQKIPHDKEKFPKMNLISDYKTFERNKYKYKNIPKEILNPEKIPTQIEIDNFFYQNQNRKITSQEIINKLYKKK